MAIDDYELKIRRIKSEIKKEDIKKSIEKPGKLGHRKIQGETNSPTRIKTVSNEVFKNQNHRKDD